MLQMRPNIAFETDAVQRCALPGAAQRGRLGVAIDPSSYRHTPPGFVARHTKAHGVIHWTNACSMRRSELLLNLLNFAVGALATALTVYLGAVALLWRVLPLAGEGGGTPPTYALLYFAQAVLYVGVVGLLIVCSVFPTIFAKVLPRQLKRLQWYINYIVYLAVVVCLLFLETTSLLL